MRKSIFLFAVSALAVCFTMKAALADTAIVFQVPAANTVQLSCARAAPSGAVEHSGGSSGCQPGNWHYSLVGLASGTYPTGGQPVTAEWTTIQPSNTGICVRARTYTFAGASYQIGGWICGSGQETQTIQGGGGTHLLEVAMIRYSSSAGKPSLLNMRAHLETF